MFMMMMMMMTFLMTADILKFGYKNFIVARILKSSVVAIQRLIQLLWCALTGKYL